MQEVCVQSLVRSLVDYSPWGRKELDMIEKLTHTHTHTQLSFSLIKERFLSLLVSQNEPKGIPKGSREFAQ